MDVQGMARRQVAQERVQVVERRDGDAAVLGSVRVGIQPLQRAAVQDEGHGGGPAVELVHDPLVDIARQGLVTELNDLLASIRIASH